uniref:PDZ domain-containing protein n=1 Tax=Parascaris univalens TaxID=6257 RepID=A0A915BT68_PARUN
MALYPTLEDMVVDQYQTVQRENDTAAYMTSPFPQPSAPIYESRYSPNPPPIYESIGEFSAAKEVCTYPALPPYFNSTAHTASAQTETASTGSGATSRNRVGQIVLRTTAMIAPITSQSAGLMRANVTHGVRQVVLAMDDNGKYGMRFRSINKGIFVQFVADGSPAAAAGIRFGDQILKINDTEMVGMNADKAMDLMTKSKNPDNLLVTLRDRPFERTITLHKDSNGSLGFTHKENLITAIVKDSSASRNGLLINHRILEVDGRNVMAYKSKDVKACLNEAPQTVTLTIMPDELYDDLVKKMDWSLMKKQDHSVPEIPLF